MANNKTNKSLQIGEIPNEDNETTQDILNRMLEQAKITEAEEKDKPKLKWITELTKKEFYTMFVEHLYNEKGIKFIKDADFEPIQAVLQYFIQDKEFYNNDSVRNNPRFHKGLLCMGNPGTLKTETLYTIGKIWNKLLPAAPRNVEKITFCSASQFISNLQSFSKEQLFIEIKKIEAAPNLIIDDLKTERNLSNYGKFNIFDSILHNRSHFGSNKKTFITANYNGKCICQLSRCKCGFNPKLDNDFQAGMQEFRIKYSDQVFDKLYEMCNIIEFKGESKRF